MLISPIVFFVYNRPDHTFRVLQALKKNLLANESDLIIYSDAARNDFDAVRVEMVREIIAGTSGFKSLRLIERKENYGLARNILEGVTEVCDEFGRVIVLEDDILTSSNFLLYMNNALELYDSQKNVWHIAGWNYQLKCDSLDDFFFWRVMNCWGWATWKDRWDMFEKNPLRLLQSWSDEKIRNFNVDGEVDFWSQVLANIDGSKNTWAIFWYATIFENKGLCLTPKDSLVINIGHDGSGENCVKLDFTEYDFVSEMPVLVPNLPISENALAVRLLKKHMKIQRNIFFRLKNKIFGFAKNTFMVINND